MSRAKVCLADQLMGDAQKYLIKVMEETWPVGETIRVKVGASITRIKVSGYGSYWANPGRVLGINVETGKSRKFHYTAIIEEQEHDQQND